jgi:hypothetical protein
LYDSSQRGQVGADVLTLQTAGVGCEQLLGSLVGKQDLAAHIDGDDSRRAAFHQRLELFFRFPPQLHQVAKMLARHHAAISQEFGNEQARSYESRRTKNKVNEGLILRKVGEIKHGTSQRHNDDLRPGKKASHDHDGKQIQESERNVGLDIPIHHCDCNKQDPGYGE